jgi:two-component sensor histidine kinase
VAKKVANLKVVDKEFHDARVKYAMAHRRARALAMAQAEAQLYQDQKKEEARYCVVVSCCYY